MLYLMIEVFYSSW